MSKTRFVGMFGLTLFLTAGWQSPQKRHEVGEEMTSDELAVYRAVLERYASENEGRFNLANETVPFTTPLGPGSPCGKGLDLEMSENSARVVHRFPSEEELHPEFVLVDRERQEAKIEANDPQNFLMGAVNERGEIDKEQMARTIRRAFESGLFTLSEIAFDGEHSRAIVSYAFRCGRLCGHGATWVLERKDESWVVTRRCEEWIS